jgi:hypothetical protein
MSRSKKDIVDAAVREYIDAHRDEINAGVKTALGQLNGSDAAAIAMMTRFSTDELEDLGGFAKVVVLRVAVRPVSSKGSSLLRLP